jgi:hypothetical protein
MSFITRLFRRDAMDTSIEAAEALDVTNLELVVLNAVRRAGRDGITQDELLQKYPKLSYSSVTARPAALKRKGLIVDSGLRRKGRSGRNQAVLVLPEFAQQD